MSKICNKCHIEKPNESFDKRYDRTGGRRGTCRDCQRPSKRKSWNTWYSKNKTYQDSRKKKWLRKNSDRVALYRMRYYLANREKRKAYTRRYYWENHEECTRKAREYQRARRGVSLDWGWDEGRKAFGLEADAISALFNEAENSVHEIMLELSNSEVAWCNLFMHDGIEIPDNVMSSIRSKVADVLFD